MISIVAPVLNEVEQIKPFLRHLRARAPMAEIVVVDGGSTDGTFQMAEGLCDHLLKSTRSRPNQLNAGARQTGGEALWFVHTDCEISSQAVTFITDSLRDGFVGGCFRIEIPDRRLVFRIHDGWAHWIGKMLRVRCGDHGIFCTRKAFEAVGGFRDVPIMEDVDFVRALHRIGNFAWLQDRMVVSARRHNQVGPYWYTFVCCAIVALYCVGAKNSFLAKLYQWLVPSRGKYSTQKPLSPVERDLFKEHREIDIGPNKRF